MSNYKFHVIGKLVVCLLILSLFLPVADVGLADVVAFQNLNTHQDDVSVFLPLVAAGGTSMEPGSAFRTVNATYFNSTIVERAMGIFWFGKVTPTENYADVRVGYNATDLVIDVRIIDQQIWYDKESPSIDDLTEWDAVTLLISTSTTPGGVLTTNEYKIVAQLSHWQDRVDYQAVYQGNNVYWTSSNLSFTSEAAGYWQQEGGPNDNQEEDFGWMVRLTIPFENLGYSTPPHDALWRLGMVLHDLDDAANTPIEDKIWPETLNPVQPETWGGLHFGQVSSPQSVDPPDGITTIKNGIDGAVVTDAHVGGAFNCGDGIDHWTEWGNKNYENIDPTKINIQNQTLVGDWPCFSKYYITFPLDTVPAGNTIISAVLTMNHFGNSGIGWVPWIPSSWIQVFTVDDDWIDTSITWNNAPLAFENIGMTLVEPLDEYPGWPGIPIDWNVSRAVDAAYRSGLPLRLALYSADSEMHSGKYFFSSDSNSDNSARPVLTVYWSTP